MKAQMTHRAYLGWRRYWRMEPWGPWRDNMHTALLAKELRRPQVRRGTIISLDQFMVRDPEERAEERKGNFFTFLRSVARRVSSGDER